MSRRLIRSIYSKLFRVDTGCDGCGRCADICPTANITMSDRNPEWGRDCLLCLSCELICPHHAITSVIDWSAITPVMRYNVRRAVKKGTPYRRLAEGEGHSIFAARRREWNR